MMIYNILSKKAATLGGGRIRNLEEYDTFNNRFILQQLLFPFKTFSKQTGKTFRRKVANERSEAAVTKSE